MAVYLFWSTALNCDADSQALAVQQSCLSSANSILNIEPAFLPDELWR